MGEVFLCFARGREEFGMWGKGFGGGCGRGEEEGGALGGWEGWEGGGWCGGLGEGEEAVRCWGGEGGGCAAAFWAGVGVEEDFGVGVGVGGVVVRDRFVFGGVFDCLHNIDCIVEWS